MDYLRMGNFLFFETPKPALCANKAHRIKFDALRDKAMISMAGLGRLPIDYF
jgi:hypothetical protein